MTGDGEATRTAAPVVDVVTMPSLNPSDVIDEEAERYVIDKTLGSGGMGVVLSARGEHLGRAVAVKLITADRDDLRRRFDRDARVTARLQHPAIVPVYGRGRVADGRPFYVMKHVSGQPLDQAIAGADTLAKRLALLPNVIAVTEAIAYAHAERVIHRDLKPANVLVGKYGETVVIDWGLAKDLAATDDEATLSPYRGDGDHTAIGKVMGTPAYMPLEQARGEAIDERADVYALGAMLYHVLAGHAPYKRGGEASVPWESMLARVIAAPPDPLAGDVPPELLAIVQRAMARDAKDRYPSAGELAEDLRRFQTGQLVGAHRYSTWQLVKRWARRHRGVLVVGTLAIVVIAALSAIGIDRIVTERDRAEDNQRIAEANSEKAEQLVDFMMTELQPRLDQIGKLALFDVVAERVVDYYAHGSITTPEQQRRYATAVVSQAAVASARGDTASAEKTFARALDMLAPLVARDRRGQSLNETYYRVKDQLLIIAIGRRDTAAALAGYQAIRDEIASIPPPLPDWAERTLTIAWHKTGVVYEDAGDYARARDAYATSLDRRRRNLAHDAEAANQEAIADGLERHAYMLLRLGDAKTAADEVHESEALIDKLLAASPQDANLVESKAISAFKRGELAADAKDPRGEIAAYDEARAAFAKLVELDPTNLPAVTKLGSTYAKLSDAYDDLHDQPHEREALAKYVELSESVARADPKNDEAARAVTLAHMRVGSAAIDDKRYADALAEYRLILDTNERRLAAHPNNTIHTDNAFVWQQLGKIEDKLGDVVAAEAAYKHSVDEDGVAVAAQPGNLDWQHDLMVRRYVTWHFLEQHGRTADAIALARSTAEAYEAAIPRTASTSLRIDVSSVWGSLGELEERAHHVDDAIRDTRHGLAIDDALLADVPTAQNVLDDDHDMMGVLARMLAEAGHADEAKKLVGDALARVDAAKSPALADKLRKQLATLH